jgi:hypothetical protein
MIFEIKRLFLKDGKTHPYNRAEGNAVHIKLRINRLK